MKDQTCPYAPRHQPRLHGVCDYCGQMAPEPWYVQRRPEPAQLVAEIVALFGDRIGPTAAQKIADALFGYADSAFQVTEIMVREAWEQEGYRQRVRQDLRRKLFDEIAKQGRIPTALPSEAIRYLNGWAWLGGDPDREGTEVPPDVIANGAPYERVQIILAVTVRTPPVDREAAVRAGVL